MTRLEYSGTVDLRGNVNARVTAQLLHNFPVFGPLVSPFLWPVSKLFEYHVTGTLENPKKDPVYRAQTFPPAAASHPHPRRFASRRRRFYQRAGGGELTNSQIRMAGASSRILRSPRRFGGTDGASASWMRQPAAAVRRPPGAAKAAAGCCSPNPRGTIQPAFRIRALSSVIQRRRIRAAARRCCFAGITGTYGGGGVVKKPSLWTCGWGIGSPKAHLFGMGGL